MKAAASSIETLCNLFRRRRRSAAILDQCRPCRTQPKTALGRLRERERERGRKRGREVEGHALSASHSFRQSVRQRKNRSDKRQGASKAFPDTIAIRQTDRKATGLTSVGGQFNLFVLYYVDLLQKLVFPFCRHFFRCPPARLTRHPQTWLSLP